MNWHSLGGYLNLILKTRYRPYSLNMKDDDDQETWVSGIISFNLGYGVAKMKREHKSHNPFNSFPHDGIWQGETTEPEIKLCVCVCVF